MANDWLAGFAAGLGVGWLNSTVGQLPAWANLVMMMAAMMAWGLTRELSDNGRNDDRA
jgi:hypothetical protein